MTLLAATPAASSSPFTGSRILSDGQAISSAFKNGDWLDGGIAFLQGLGDLAAAAADPIGTLVKCGLGWVMSHLGPLSTWLNQLAGSQEAVDGVASQWTSTGSTMRSAGTTLATRLKDLDGLKGKTVEAYTAFARDAAAHIHASGDWADGVAKAMTDAGQLVSKMQSVVKSAISSVMATAIEAMAVVAASLGLGMGYAIARVVTKVNEMVNKVAKPILKVLQSVKSLVTMVQSVHQLFDSTKSLVSGMLNGAPTNIAVAPVVVADLGATNLLTSTGTTNLQLAGSQADGRIGDVLSVSVDGPIAGGRVDMSGLGTGAGGAGAGSVTIGSVGLGGAGSNSGTSAAAGGVLGGAAITAARVAGVSTGGAGAGGGTGMIAPARTGAMGAEGMGSRTGRRAKRLTVEIVENTDDLETVDDGEQPA